MKKIIAIMTILSLVTNAFAYEGAADTLAGIILFIPGLTIFALAIALPIVGIQWLFELACNYWGKATTFGKIVVFGIPGTALSCGICYVLINYIAPYVVIHPYISLIAFVVLFYFSCAFIGWEYGNTDRQRDGRVALVARCIVKIPVYPFILIGFVFKVIWLFVKRLFVKPDYNSKCKFSCTEPEDEALEYGDELEDETEFD